ncbi:MAG: dehypoxanthine futalosine cyclase, partial [Firmicutes bacterium]|nr:dehypoxanthine futalosine cyclase [Bacillota bacterium]
MRTLSSVGTILARAVDGERLSAEEGARLYYEADLLSLGRAADSVRRRMHPGGIVTFVVDRNINYTNVCTFRCRFCAFSKGPLSLNLRGT